MDTHPLKINISVIFYGQYWQIGHWLMVLAVEMLIAIWATWGLWYLTIKENRTVGRH